MASSALKGLRASALETLNELSHFLAASIARLSSAAAAGHANSTFSKSLQEDGSASSNASAGTVLSDLRSLLALISKETTNLSLAFAPPKEHWDAVQGTAKKLLDLSGKTIYGLKCLRAISAEDDTVENMLAKQWRISALGVFETLKDLSDASVSTYKSLGDKIITASQRKQLLVHTSHVWKAIEHTETLPSTEHEAFLQAWKTMQGTFDDAMVEVQEITAREPKGKEMAVNQDAEDEQEDDHDSDDFDFDDLEDDEPLSEEELAVVHSMYHLMKLVKALMRKLSTLNKAVSWPYSHLHTQGQQIAALHDDLASEADAPQNWTAIRQATKKYQQATTSLIATLLTSLADESLAKDLSTVELAVEPLQDGQKHTQSTDVSQWYRLCQQQIDKAVLSLLNTAAEQGER